MIVLEKGASNYLHKGLDSASLGDALLAHVLCHFSWVSGDTGDEGVAVLSVLDTLIARLISLMLNDFLPSSCCLTMRAFRPAYRPARRMTTFPGLINLTMVATLNRLELSEQMPTSILVLKIS